MTMRAEIAKVERELGAAVLASHQERLEAYFSLLQRWGQRIRLTGTGAGAELVWRHLPDALVAAALIDDLFSAGKGGPSIRMLDVGSGGGLPALPLAILRPRLSMVMVEANQRKAAFLRNAVHELGLGERVGVRDVRFEALAVEAFELVASRATFAPEVWVGRALPWLGAEGALLVFVGREERAPGVALCSRLGLTQSVERRYRLRDETPRLLLSYRRDSTLADH